MIATKKIRVAKLGARTIVPGREIGALLQSLRHARREGRAVPYKDARKAKSYLRAYGIANRDRRRALARARVPDHYIVAELAHQSAVHTAVEALLEAPEFHSRDIWRLASASFPDAMKHLLTECRTVHELISSPVESLLDPTGRFRAWRLARDFGAVPASLKPDTRFNPDDLRQLARHDEKARVALACYGELLEGWDSAGRKERAGFCLGRLVASWRERSR